MNRFFILSIIGIFVAIFTVAAVAPQINRLTLEKELVALQNQLREKEKSFINPSPQDKAQYSQFLSQPDTGIFRLLTRGGTSEKLMTVWGGGTYYSFTRITNEGGHGNDLRLELGRFRMNNGNNFGLISLIGDVSIDSITFDHPSIEFLKNPVSQAPTFKELRNKIQAGFRNGDFTYTTEVAAAPNTTYVLRSIDPPGSDIIVALRVIKREEDGSLVIIWKKLKTFPAPVSAR
jgi:hypothetical protein